MKMLYNIIKKVIILALPTNVKNILNMKIVEQSRIEFKSGWDPEPIIHTICAFANDIDNFSGGYIFIGVEEYNGKPILPIRGLGPELIDKIQKELIEYCNKCIEPRYIPVIDVENIDGNDFIVLWVPAGSDRPYKCRIDVYSKTNFSTTYYIRKGSTTIEARNNDEKELFEIGGLQPYDDRPNYKASLNDLSLNLIKSYLSDISSNLLINFNNMSIENITEDMRISEGPTENLKPKNVGLLFFTYEPEKFIPYSYIELTDIPDPTGEGMYEQSFRGPLHIQYKDIMLYLKNNVIKEKVYKIPNQMEAKRFYNYSYEVLDEVIGNALLHKNYQIHEPISVRINKDSIEVTSFPGLDSSISVENIKKLQIKSKKYRNRRIGEFLKELHIVEAKNTGFPTIIKYSNINGSPLPIIETDNDRTYVTVVIPIHPDFLQNEKNNQPKKESLDKRITKLVKNNPLSLSEISVNLGYKTIPGSLKNALLRLVNNNIIKVNNKKYFI